MTLTLHRPCRVVVDGALAVNNLVFLTSRGYSRDSASLVSGGPHGYIHMWNVYHGGSLMAQFPGVSEVLQGAASGAQFPGVSEVLQGAASGAQFPGVSEVLQGSIWHPDRPTTPAWRRRAESNTPPT